MPRVQRDGPELRTPTPLTPWTSMLQEQRFSISCSSFPYYGSTLVPPPSYLWFISYVWNQFGSRRWCD